jgi:hypothetical protein
VTESTVAVVSLLVLGWAVISGPLARHNITGPLLFMIAGYLLGNPDWGPLSVDVEAPSIHVGRRGGARPRALLRCTFQRERGDPEGALRARHPAC